MKPVNQILSNVLITKTIGNLNVESNAINFDSRAIKSNDLFIAVRGTQTDGHLYIEKAIENGANAVVCEDLPQTLHENITYIVVENSEKALGQIAANFYDSPSQKLKLVGVTGTNGKTTTATLLYRLFQGLGYKVGLLSTISYFIDNQEFTSTHTTPDSIQLNALLQKMVEAGCEYCFMEVSSHAVAQHRIEGLSFAGGIFTNLTHDHLDYHKTFAEYLKAKKTFFDSLPKTAFALTNSDDKNGKIMLQNTKAQCFTYGIRTFADFKCKVLESSFEGMQLELDHTEFWTRFVGQFNAYNLLAIYTTALLLGEEKEKILVELSNMNSVNGRFEPLYSKNGITAIVDYAHTPDALQNVLQTIHEIRNLNQNIITVVGAGGNRDKTKRPAMAKIAAENSDKLILTSDNPRNEEPEAILNDMQTGITSLNAHKVLVISDRHQAIRTACMLAKKGDIILVAGKGHETYQEIKGVRHHFDDKEELQKCFEL